MRVRNVPSTSNVSRKYMASSIHKSHITYKFLFNNFCCEDTGIFQFQTFIFLIEDITEGKGSLVKKTKFLEDKEVSFFLFSLIVQK